MRPAVEIDGTDQDMLQPYCKLECSSYIPGTKRKFRSEDTSEEEEGKLIKEKKTVSSL
jgi:hypothetical protein